MEDAAVKNARRAVSQTDGVGGLAIDLLRVGGTNEEVLAEVLRAYPSASTKMNSIRWYRHQLRLAGEDVPSAVQARHGVWRPRMIAA